MKNKVERLRILGMILIFGVLLIGCLTTPPPNYYNLGNVSEEDSAIIDVQSGSPGSGEYAIHSFIQINGQGDHLQWHTNRVPFVGEGKALVRVTPGAHTFTMNFVYEEKAIPVNITFDCKAGMGYTFQLVVKNIAGGVLLNPIAAEIIAFERAVDQNGNWGRLPTIVARHTETFHQEALRMR